MIACQRCGLLQREPVCILCHNEASGIRNYHGSAEQLLLGFSLLGARHSYVVVDVDLPIDLGDNAHHRIMTILRDWAGVKDSKNDSDQARETDRRRKVRRTYKESI